MEKGSPSYLKEMNQMAIMRYILKNGSATRAELSKALHLSKPTTSVNVDLLIGQHLLCEMGIEKSVVGKKGILLDVNQQQHYVAVFDSTSQIYHGKLVLVICDLKGTIVDSVDISYDYRRHTQFDFFKVLGDYMKRHQSFFKNVECTVLSLPGVVSESTVKGVNISLDRQQFIREVSQFNQGSFLVENDVNLALLGEHSMYESESCKNMAYVRIAGGIGGAFLFDGKLYTGKKKAAGELGFYKVPVFSQGKRASVPITNLISFHDVMLNMQSHYKNSDYLKSLNKKNFNKNDFIQGVQLHDEWCVREADKILFYAEDMLCNLARNLDLDELIVVGWLTELDADFIGRLKRSVNEYGYTDVKVMKGRLDNPCIQGGYTLGLDHVLNHVIHGHF